jgi:hypothetical protein
MLHYAGPARNAAWCTPAMCHTTLHVTCCPWQACSLCGMATDESPMFIRQPLFWLCQCCTTLPATPHACKQTSTCALTLQRTSSKHRCHLMQPAGLYTTQRNKVAINSPAHYQYHGRHKKRKHVQPFVIMWEQRSAVSVAALCSRAAVVSNSHSSDRAHQHPQQQWRQQDAPLGDWQRHVQRDNPLVPALRDCTRQQHLPGV